MQALYEREREIEIEIGREDVDAMAWEDEVERHFEDEMSHVCESYEVWHQRLVEEVAENRRIDEAEYDRTEVEYEMDRMWMAHELAANCNYGGRERERHTSTIHACERKKQKEARRLTNIVQEEKSESREQQEKYVQHLGVKTYRIIVIICTRLV